MKALILSGGTGSRLRPLSHSTPKQLVPVLNRPVLEHVLDNVRELGITEIGLIVGAGDRAVPRAIGDGARFGARITYLPQDRPSGLADCVRIARPFLGGDDFVMYLGDNMLPEGIADCAARFRAERPAAQLVLKRVADPTAFGVAELDGTGRVLRLTEKPREPRSDLAMIGVYFFTAAIHAAVAAIAPSPRGELEITDAVQWLVDRGEPVGATEYAGYWKDIGRIEDVLDCNRWMLARQTGSVAGEVDPASTVAEDVVVERGARVLRSRIDAPALVGAGSVIEDSHVGPGSAIGRDCLVKSTRLLDSVVLDGASISHVSGLRSSLIGRGATIGRSRDDRELHRLIVGDDTRTEIAA
ncbi:glucose-1-phosphate thymidylyltransferase [Actinomadura livida]|uniref:Glucose-1-phosphate thymidylyltransferase n=1 Tax=Actinomadura livida TaxID=79909 RepID=A0A7W7I8D2_9ACTN|nr:MULTISPECIES: glucose-1-phosphate thymidylyltransferase [Actinomadura]MBB4772397.1 glucose-1-phosphate thymidylyltransferase [Actinomadura catellatispora]GGU23216.1 glucose-1-phosphate thymidylyltransferase [Actinomadura livida]